MTKTLLICLDGATFTILDPLMEDGLMPFLKRFVEAGVRAELVSTPHPLTPPAFTSMITGRSPGWHGIFDFIRAEEREDGYFFTLYDSRDIRCETVWSIANRYRHKVIVLNFVLTSPVKPLDGYVVPGMVHWRHLRRHTYPAELYDRIKNLPGFDAKRLAWDFKQEEKALHLVEEDEYEDWIVHHIEREGQWFRIMRYLMEKDPAELSAIVFDGGDKIQHLCWQFLDPRFLPDRLSDREQRLQELGRQYFRKLDEYLRDLVELSGPDTRVFMASDHGFGPTFMRFRVNQLLSDLGYLKWNDDNPGSEKKDRPDSDIINVDWEKTVAYARTRSSNGIYIRRAGRSPGQPGIPAEKCLAFRETLARELLNFKDPETGEKVVADILFPEDAFPGPASGQAPDLTLIMADRSFVSISPGYPLVERRRRVGGTHYPEGIFLAAGPSIRKGVKLQALSILDVAPALLYSLGVPVPENFEGKFPAAVFEDDYLAQQPLTAGPPAQSQDQAGGRQQEEAYSDKEKKDVYDQLRALGYMD